jgi:hypothetical protein
MNKRKIPAITAQQFKKVRKQSSFLEFSAKGTSRFDSVGLSNMFSDENKGLQTACTDKNKIKRKLFQIPGTEAKEKRNIHIKEKDEEMSKSLIFPVPIKEVKSGEDKISKEDKDKESGIKFTTLPVTSLITQDFQRKKRLNTENEQENKSSGGMYAKSDNVSKLKNVLKLKKVKYQPFNVDVNSERNKAYNLQIPKEKVKGLLMRTYKFQQDEDLGKEIKKYVRENELSNNQEVIYRNAKDDSDMELIKVSIDQSMDNTSLLLETQKYINVQLYKKVSYLNQKVNILSETLNKVLNMSANILKQQNQIENMHVIERQMERKNFMDQKAEIMNEIQNKIRSFSEDYKYNQIINEKCKNTKIKELKATMDIYLFLKGTLSIKKNKKQRKKTINFDYIMKIKKRNARSKIFIFPQKEIDKNMYLSDFWNKFHLGDLCVITESIICIEQYKHNQNQISLIVNTKDGQKHIVLFYIDRITIQLHCSMMLDNKDEYTKYYAIIPRTNLLLTFNSIPNYLNIEYLNNSNASYFLTEWDPKLKGLVTPEALLIHGKTYYNTHININCESNIIQVINHKQKQENIDYINSLIRKSKIDYTNPGLYPAITYEMINKDNTCIKVEPEIINLLNRSEKYVDIMRYQRLSYMPWDKYIFKDIRKLLDLKLFTAPIPSKHIKRFMDKLTYIYNFKNITRERDIQDCKDEINNYLDEVRLVLDKYPKIKNTNCLYEKFMKPKAIAKDIYGISQMEIVEVIKENLKNKECTYDNVLTIFSKMFRKIKDFKLITKLVPIAKPGRDYSKLEMKHNDIRPLTVQPSIIAVLDKLCKRIYDLCVIGSGEDQIPTNAFGFIKESNIPYTQLQILNTIEELHLWKQQYIILQFDLEDFYNTISNYNIQIKHPIEKCAYNLYKKEYITFNNQITQRTIGVPQGSVWSPHFAMKIMNNFKYIKNLQNAIFYVDDGQIVIKYTDEKEISSKIQAIYNTMKTYGITFNLQKLNIIADRLITINLVDMFGKIITINTNTTGKCLGIDLNYNGTLNLNPITDKNLKFIEGLKIKTLDRVTKYHIFTLWVRSRYQALIPISVYKNQIDELYIHLNTLYNYMLYGNAVYREHKFKYLSEVNVFKWIIWPSLEYVNRIFNYINARKECEKILNNIADYCRTISTFIIDTHIYLTKVEITDKLSYLRWHISKFLSNQKQNDLDSINAQIIQNRLIYKEGVNIGFIEEDLLEFIANTNRNGYYAYLYQLMRKNLNFVDFIDIDEFNLEMENDIDFEEKVVQSLTLKYIFMLKTFEKYENKNNKTNYVYTTENNLVIDKRSIYFWSILKNFHELAMEDKEIDELLNKEKIMEEILV